MCLLLMVLVGACVFSYYDADGGNANNDEDVDLTDHHNNDSYTSINQSTQWVPFRFETTETQRRHYWLAEAKSSVRVYVYPFTPGGRANLRAFVENAVHSSKIRTFTYLPNVFDALSAAAIAPLHRRPQDS